MSCTSRTSQPPAALRITSRGTPAASASAIAAHHRVSAPLRKRVAVSNAVVRSCCRFLRSSGGPSSRPEYRTCQRRNFHAPLELPLLNPQVTREPQVLRWEALRPGRSSNSATPRISPLAPGPAVTMTRLERGRKMALQDMPRARRTSAPSPLINASGNGLHFA